MFDSKLVEEVAKAIHAATLPKVAWRDLRADSRIQKRTMAECALIAAETYLSLPTPTQENE